MNHHTLIDLDNLFRFFQNPLEEPGLKVSIYLSLPHSSTFSLTGKALLKTASRTAMERLDILGATVEVREKISISLDRLLNEASFWERHSDSLAIFVSGSVLRCLRLPFVVGDSVWVGPEIHVLPLVRHRDTPGQFFIAKVDEGHPRLLKIHPEFAEELETEELVSLKEYHDRYTTISDEHSHSIRVTHTSGGADRGTMIPHGSKHDDRQEEATHQLERMARAVSNRLRNETAPLFLLGTQNEVARFRAELDYRFQLPAPAAMKLSLNVPTTDAESRTLFGMCAAVDLEHEWQSKNALMLESYKTLRGTGETSENCEEIIRKARQGLVKTLLIRDPKNAPATRSTLPSRGSAGCSNLEGTNVAALLTLLHRGEVAEIDDPTFTPETIAAVFRS